MTIKTKLSEWKSKSMQKAFLKAYDLYIDQIYRFVFFKVQSKEDAEDLTSEAFLKTWNYLQGKGLKEDLSLRALIYKITRNLIIDHYRSKPNLISLDQEENPGLQIQDEKQDIALNTDLNLEISKVKKRIKELKSEYQEIIILHFLEELSVAEIADILSKTKGNTRVLLYRAVKALKEKF